MVKHSWGGGLGEGFTLNLSCPSCGSGSYRIRPSTASGRGDACWSPMRSTRATMRQSHVLLRWRASGASKPAWVILPPGVAVPPVQASPQQKWTEREAPTLPRPGSLCCQDQLFSQPQKQKYWKQGEEGAEFPGHLGSQSRKALTCLTSRRDALCRRSPGLGQSVQSCCWSSDPCLPGRLLEVCSQRVPLHQM